MAAPTVLASQLVDGEWRAEPCPHCTTTVRGTRAAWDEHDRIVHRDDADSLVDRRPLRLVVDDRQMNLFEIEREEDTCEDTPPWSWPPL